MLIGAAVLVTGVGAVTYGVVQSAEPSGAAEGVVAEALTADGRDLSTVTNEELEAVVAANPDIVGMRLALARRYFEAGELSAALGHYLEVVDRQPHPEALANLGWITFLASDEYEVAARYEEVALELSPDWTPAYWYLANIRFSGLGDAAGAAEALRELLAREGVPDEIRSNAENLLATIEAGG
jgi:tetratricopeptide (TPR) repeat protein